MRFLTKLLCFCLFVTHVFAEETLFKSLASSYLNNPQINSQREKTKAVDETLIQAYSNFKPTIEGTISKTDSTNKKRNRLYWSIGSRFEFPISNKFYNHYTKIISRNF